MKGAQKGFSSLLNSESLQRKEQSSQDEEFPYEETSLGAVLPNFPSEAT